MTSLLKHVETNLHRPRIWGGGFGRPIKRHLSVISQQHIPGPGLRNYDFSAFDTALGAVAGDLLQLIVFVPWARQASTCYALDLAVPKLARASFINLGDPN